MSEFFRVDSVPLSRVDIEVELDQITGSRRMTYKVDDYVRVEPSTPSER